MSANKEDLVRQLELLIDEVNLQHVSITEAVFTAAKIGLQTAEDISKEVHENYGRGEV